ncbi:hypothetical protein R3P38DRAFT_2983345 [Favolaschia claudopus]|uniref:Transcription regulator Rua1 C-terminal domain-containing protein n=1 Tax=Favolaschia claudopus TaxID=2862362 RepID=A0AAW0AYF5_9AGAR
MALFLDQACPMDTTSPSSMEIQYSHIQSPDFLPLASPFDQSSVSSLGNALNASVNVQVPSGFPLWAAPHPAATSRSATSGAETFCVDATMSTPSDVSMSLPTATPSKGLEYSDDWIPSGSPLSPVTHTQNSIKLPPLSLVSSPTMSFMDRIKASSSPPIAIPSVRSPCSASFVPLLLSPCQLSAPTHAEKENSIPTPFRIADIFASSPLKSAPSSPAHPAKGRRVPQKNHARFPLSPLPPLTPSHKKNASFRVKNSMPVPDARPKKRRLSLSIPESPTMHVKRARYDLPEEQTMSRLAVSVPTQNGCVYTMRAAPSCPVDAARDFPLLYRRFPVSSYFSRSPYAPSLASHPEVVYKAREAFDLYSPRFVVKEGGHELGLCPICVEPQVRGGEGKEVWLSTMTSQSSYNDHVELYHGISAFARLPFSPPIEFRVVSRRAVKRGERAKLKQGKCHKCLCWVFLEPGSSDVSARVPEALWWKHAAVCHLESAELEDVFEQDEVHASLKSYRR